MKEDEFSFSTILYAINAYVLSCLIIGGMSLFAGELSMNKILGFGALIPVLVAQTYSQINPDYFYYMWFGPFKILGAALYIYALTHILSLDSDSHINGMYLMILIVGVIQIIPMIGMPISMKAIRWGWRGASNGMEIGPQPNYMINDIVIPSILLGSSIIGLGYAI